MVEAKKREYKIIRLFNGFEVPNEHYVQPNFTASKGLSLSPDIYAMAQFNHELDSFLCHQVLKCCNCQDFSLFCRTG